MATKIEIFEITLPPHGVFRFTSAQQTVSFGGESYEPVQISRGEKTTSADASARDTVTLKMPVEINFAQLFDTYPPLQDAEISIRRGDLALNGSTLTNVESVITGVLLRSGSDGREASFLISPRLTAANRVGPVGTYSSLCRHSLYSRGCGVDKSEFQSTANVVGLNEELRRITVRIDIPAKENQFFRGGVLQTSASDDPILIINQLGPSGPIGGQFQYVLTLAQWSIQLLAEPATVLLFPGCPFTRETCASRFDNLSNFGGFPSLPGVDRSPFFQGWRR